MKLSHKSSHSPTFDKCMLSYRQTVWKTCTPAKHEQALVSLCKYSSLIQSPFTFHLGCFIRKEMKVVTRSWSWGRRRRVLWGETRGRVRRCCWDSRSLREVRRASSLRCCWNKFAPNLGQFDSFCCQAFWLDPNWMFAWNRGKQHRGGRRGGLWASH